LDRSPYYPVENKSVINICYFLYRKVALQNNRIAVVLRLSGIKALWISLTGEKTCVSLLSNIKAQFRLLIGQHKSETASH